MNKLKSNEWHTKYLQQSQAQAEFIHIDTMGNCIDKSHFLPLQKIKDFVCCEGEDFNLALPIEKIACGAYEGLKLTSQAFTTSSAVLEVGRGAPPLPVRVDDAILKPADLCKLRKATIVVSKEQLELLLRNSKKFGSKGIAVQFSDTFQFDEPCPRWRPALPTIPEVHNF